MLFAFKTVLSLLESDSGVTAYILTLVSDRSLTVSECSLSLYLLLDLIIIGGNADISRYFVPFNLSTCAVRLVRISNLLKLNVITTANGGSLGSLVDEERS